MRAFVRFAAAWLVVLALPLQGWAAGAMLHCGDGRAGGAAGVTAPVHDEPAGRALHHGPRAGGERHAHQGGQAAAHGPRAPHGAHHAAHHAARQAADHAADHLADHPAGASGTAPSAMSAHADAHGAGDPGFEDKASAGHGHKCSACAVCCLGVGLPASAPRFDATAASFKPTIRVATPAPSHVPGGPERPPRSIFA